MNGFNETCVAVKTADDDYVFQPTEVNPLLALAIARIDNNAVMSMSSEVLPSIIDSIQPGQRQLVIEATGMKIPIVQSLEEVHSSLTMVSRACIVVRERVMLVWSNDPRTIVNSGHDIETQLLGLVSISLTERNIVSSIIELQSRYRFQYPTHLETIISRSPTPSAPLLRACCPWRNRREERSLQKGCGPRGRR